MDQSDLQGGQQEGSDRTSIFHAVFLPQVPSRLSTETGEVEADPFIRVVSPRLPHRRCPGREVCRAHETTGGQIGLESADFHGGEYVSKTEAGSDFMELSAVILFLCRWGGNVFDSVGLQ